LYFPDRNKNGANEPLATDSVLYRDFSVLLFKGLSEVLASGPEQAILGADESGLAKSVVLAYHVF